MKQAQVYVIICSGRCVPIYIKTYLFKYYYVSNGEKYGKRNIRLKILNCSWEIWEEKKSQLEKKEKKKISLQRSNIMIKG